MSLLVYAILVPRKPLGQTMTDLTETVTTKIFTVRHMDTHVEMGQRFFRDFIAHSRATGTLEPHVSVGPRIGPTEYAWALMHAFGTAPDGSRWMASWTPRDTRVSMKPATQDMLDYAREQTAEREAEERALAEMAA